MAGSYGHCVDDSGRLFNPFDLSQMIENGGDVYEAVEQLFGMVWYLAGGDAATVERSRVNYRQGLRMSPGVSA